MAKSINPRRTWLVKLFMGKGKLPQTQLFDVAGMLRLNHGSGLIYRCDTILKIARSQVGMRIEKGVKVHFTQTKTRNLATA